MSTGVLQHKLEQQAALHGVEANITALPLVEFEKNPVKADVFLLGPQIRYAEDDVKKLAGGARVYTISPADFGMMNAQKIWNDITK